MSLNYYILDTETTGLKAGYHEIIQISIIRCEDKYQKTFNIRAEYPERASFEALQITGKTRFDLTKGIEKVEAVTEISSFFEEDQKTPEHRVIVAHNSSFDQRFCHALWSSVRQPFHGENWLCTKEFTKKYAQKQGLQKIAELQNQPKAKFTLPMCLVALGITPRQGQHNAMIDVQNTYTLWKALMEQNLGHVGLIKRKRHEI